MQASFADEAEQVGGIAAAWLSLRSQFGTNSRIVLLQEAGFRPFFLLFYQLQGEMEASR